MVGPLKTSAMKTQTIAIYDTTLRDGAQGQGINFSVADKLRIAEKLDDFGVHYIEGGWPGSNPKDIEFFQSMKGRKLRSSLLSAFGSTRKKNVRVEEDEQLRKLLEAETPVVTIFGKTSMLHVMEVLRCSPEENLAMIGDTVRFLKEKGKHVIYDAEHAFDGFKNNPDYAVATLQAAHNAGADVIVLCDTNGGSLPEEVEAIVKLACGKFGDIGIHTHDDIGLGLANALVAIRAGATQVQGTINGYGERTGNCNLTSIMPIIGLKMLRPSVPEESFAKLRELSMFVDSVANMAHNPRQPWVGSAAFMHKGGGHVDAVRKIAASYEHIDPALVGNVRNISVSDLSGRSNILLKARSLGFELPDDAPETREILSRVKILEHAGYEFETADASLALLVHMVLKSNEILFEVQDYHVSMRGNGKSSVNEATVKVRVGDELHHEVAEGDGPVNALDGALRRALVGSFPWLQQVRLTDYKVRILDGVEGTASKTRALITSTGGEREWTTVGVSGNIIEASFLALSDSFKFALIHHE